eukprot:evm.model.scf_1059.7 EVM.evm.TU.scf_1059.7   scf_1059:44553-46181(-)
MGRKEGLQQKRLRAWAEAAQGERSTPVEVPAQKKRKVAKSKYQRGRVLNVDRLKSGKALKTRLTHGEHLISDAVSEAAAVDEWLKPSASGCIETEGNEKTWRVTQREIVEEVEVGAARKAFDLRLEDLGPYKVDFTRNGRFMAIAGRKGHLAEFDWQSGKLRCEVQVRETTRDIKFLHNELFWAVAQKQYVYIYNQDGHEVHCLKSHRHPLCLEFLPYHFLLCSTDDSGILRYQDTSTGRMVASLHTRKGPVHVMKQNPSNAVLSLGHSKGMVSMWTPNMDTAAVRMLCHKGPVTALAMHRGGQYMVTAGADRGLKVWDIRTYKAVQTYITFAPAKHVSISQQGLTAVGYGRTIEVWKDMYAQKQQHPYLKHMLELGFVENCQFCPYEDVLGIGHSGGVSTMLVPGAGEPNFDSWVANPFQSTKERREMEVSQLLGKVQPEMITLDPDAIGRVRSQQQAKAAQGDGDEGSEETKGKGMEKGKKVKTSRGRAHHAKQDAFFREKARQLSTQEQHRSSDKRAVQIPDNVPHSLRRFYKANRHAD